MSDSKIIWNPRVKAAIDAVEAPRLELTRKFKLERLIESAEAIHAADEKYKIAKEQIPDTQELIEIGRNVYLKVERLGHLFPDIEELAREALAALEKEPQ